MGKVLLGQTFIVLKRNEKMSIAGAPVFPFNTLVRERSLAPKTSLKK